MLLNNQWITEEIREEIKKHLETNENKSTMIQKLQVVAKAVLRGKFIAIQSYLRKQNISYIQPTPTLKATRERRRRTTTTTKTPKLVKGKKQ